LVLPETRAARGAAANKGFSEKKKVYLNSDFLLTKDVAKSVAWSPVEIDARQKERSLPGPTRYERCSPVICRITPRLGTSKFASQPQSVGLSPVPSMVRQDA
jgi:hypothetical protein